MERNTAFGEVWADEGFLEREIVARPKQILSTFLNVPNVGVAICDEQQRFQMINSALAAMNGVPGETHVGRPVAEVLGDVAPEIIEQFRQVMSQDAPLFFNISGRLPNREEVGHWVESFFPWKDSSGKISGVFALVIEVTREKQLERLLSSLTYSWQRPEERLKTLLDLNTTLAAQSALQQLFPRIQDLVKAIMPDEQASIAIHDERASSLSVYPLTGEQYHSTSTRSFKLPIQETPFAPVLVGRESEVFNRSRLARNRSEFTRQMLEQGVQSLCCIPLVSQMGMLGILSLTSTREKAFDSGMVKLLEKVAWQAAISVDQVLLTNEILLLKSKLAEQTIDVEEDLGKEFMPEIVGNSSALKGALQQVKTVAPSDSPVLILGECGTGKKLLAATLHGWSRRAGQPFVRVRCSGPLEQLNRDLFGDEEQPGHIELAQDGTLFLDEVGDLPPAIQEKCLRIMERQPAGPHGSKGTAPLNVRLVATTRHDLARGVAEGKFLRELYYRLNLFPIRIASLRERPEDIPDLVLHFVEKFARRIKKLVPTVPDNTMNALLKWKWPGNVSELEKFLERAVILTRGPELNAPLEELQRSEPD